MTTSLANRSGPGLPAGLACALLLGAATSADAAPVVSDVRFDGLGGFGVSQATALGSDIPIVPIGGLEQAFGLDVTNVLDNGSIATGPPATATSDWSVENNLGDLEQIYLVFARPLENIILVDSQETVVDYAPTDVGLTLQNDVGGFDWILFQVPVGDDLYYYPAVSLGSLGDGQSTASPFQVHYILDNPQIFLEPQGFELGIPKWQLLATTVPVPEPSTALLVGLGTLGLALGRRRRS